ncbi:MAG: hypothetical protein ACI4S3_01160, partial [Candidatus Gastranaerophilaceae bacterium]
MKKFLIEALKFQKLPFSDLYFKENILLNLVMANKRNRMFKIEKPQISDNYIASILNKPSNVVEGWIDALFLQKINLKADPDEINPDFLLEFPKKAQEKIDTQNSNPQPLQQEETVDLAQI